VPVEVDHDQILAHGIQLIVKPLVSARHLVRHDANALADALLSWLAERLQERDDWAIARPA
jgi:hypothetical protein